MGLPKECQCRQVIFKILMSTSRYRAVETEAVRTLPLDTKVQMGGISLALGHEHSRRADVVISQLCHLDFEQVL